MITVLFACVANAGRSQMAAAFFNALADPAQARAISAGTRPGRAVHPEVVTVMKEAGIDLGHRIPQPLTPGLAVTAQLVITMGCGDECPIVPGADRDDWPLDDPADQPIDAVRTLRDDIRARVLNLLDSKGWRPESADNPRISGCRPGGRISLVSENELWSRIAPNLIAFCSRKRR